MVASVSLPRNQLCPRASTCRGRAAGPSHRQALPVQPFRSTTWTVLAASTVMGPLKRRREGRPLQAASGQVGGAVAIDQEMVLHGPQDDDQLTILRYGVTNASMLPWTQAKLQSLHPEVNFSGMVMAQEAVNGDPDQLAILLNRLEAEEVDFVIAPAEDVALGLPQGLVAAAVLREDPRDALVVQPQLAPVRSLAELPSGSKVCVSGSLRRMQIAARFPMLCVEESRLPSQSILRRLYSLDYDAVVAAIAGLQRTGLHMSDEVSPLDVDELMPALCQGALTMLCRAKDEHIASLLAICDDAAARTCVVAERDLLMQLGRLPDGAAVGGVAELRSENELCLKCLLALPSTGSPALPRIFQAHQEGAAGDREAIVQSILAELEQGDPEVASVLKGDRPANAPEIATRVMQEEDEDLEEMDMQGSGNVSAEVLPTLDAKERLPAHELDCAGGTAYTGRVCAVLANGRGVLVDIDCEVPAFWYPELVSSSSSASSSQSPSPDRSGPEGLPLLGSEMEVYCCTKHSWCIRALREPPPRLARRGVAQVAPLRLEELRAGLGPWRAVVISATDDGVLVDFNCEIPGLLQSDQLHVRGEELRVYCYRVDVSMRLCIVGTVKETKADTGRRKLEDLISADTSVGIRGTVLRVTGSGVFVDVNCEVQGYLSPMDIDMMVSGSFCKGYEVTVYVKSVNLLKRQVALSMFPTRQPVRVIDGEGTSKRAQD